MVTKKPTFLNHAKPLVCAIFGEKTPDEFIADIANSLSQGAEGFCLLMEMLEKKYRNETDLKRIFAECKGLPIYVTACYRGWENADLTDDERVEYLLLCGRCGATLLDVMGDLYHPEKKELTYDEEAVAKQKALIDKIHEMGCEVLMSSHTHEFMDEETVVEYALAQQSRGADIIKIVTMSDNDEQQMANLSVINTLKQTLDKPYLFLAGGSKCTLIRQIGVFLGSCMYLYVPKYKPGGATFQPVISSSRQIRDLMGFGAFYRD